MAREIIDPRWANKEKTHIVAKFRYDDGREVIASITNEGGNNPDWAEVMEKYGVGEITKASQKHYEQHVARKQRNEENRKLHFERMQKEALFNAKADMFDIEVIRNSKNRSLKNQIRRASSIQEVQLYGTALFILEDPTLQGLFREMINGTPKESSE